MDGATEYPAGAGARLDDAALLERVQRQTFRYFWDFGHPVSGLARDRSGPGAQPDLVAVGGSGFGVLAIIVAAERGWVPRAAALARLGAMLDLLERAPRYHGVFPHFLNGRSGATIPFGPIDDGGDLVETAFLFEGLLTARQYFCADEPAETRLRARIDRLWRAVEWDWHLPEGRRALLWHWSPTHGFALNHEIRGWNECLLTYVLAAGAPAHAIPAEAYHQGWADSDTFRNGRNYYGVELPLGPEKGGPLFFAHYSFLGLDPRGLVDRYADYFEQNARHTAINRAHCIANPGGFAGYGPDCWGLTATDSDLGYRAMSPADDIGVIAPTAAIGSLPYAPDEAMAALRRFHDGLGLRIFGPLGFVSSFCETRDWYSPACLAIDQGPIIAMIENHRTGLLWRLFMSCPEVQAGLARLGFSSPHLPPAAA